MEVAQEKPRYLSCADTAKLVRRSLKDQFPGVKFSVRSSTYANGASIDVRWVDGPLTRDVEAVAKLYEGSTFDGMIDLKTPHRSLLSTEDGAELVRFAADHVMCSRDLSDEFQAELVAELEEFTGEPYDPTRRYPVGVDHYQEKDGSLCRDDHRGEWGSTIIHQMGYCRAR